VRFVGSASWGFAQADSQIIDVAIYAREAAGLAVSGVRTGWYAQLRWDTILPIST
jgi:hypothetical protein